MTEKNVVQEAQEIIAQRIREGRIEKAINLLNEKASCEIKLAQIHEKLKRLEAGEDLPMEAVPAKKSWVK